VRNAIETMVETNSNGNFTITNSNSSIRYDENNAAARLQERVLLWACTGIWILVLLVLKDLPPTTPTATAGGLRGVGGVDVGNGDLGFLVAIDERPPPPNSQDSLSAYSSTYRDYFAPPHVADEDRLQTFLMRARGP
jgi:hypothetical protein